MLTILPSFLALWIEPNFGNKTRPEERLRQDERFTITTIADDGQRIEPRRTKEAFFAQCGAIVRDMIPISIQVWNQPKNVDPQVPYVNDRQKDDLWTALKANFTLPPEEDPDKPVIEPLVKAHALRRWQIYSRGGRMR